jgi:hypothetical protein
VVPDVVGIGQADAEAAITAASLVVGKDGVYQTANGGQEWERAAPLPPECIVTIPGWFLNFGWDPHADIFYASRMGKPAYKYQRGTWLVPEQGPRRGACPYPLAFTESHMRGSSRRPCLPRCRLLRDLHSRVGSYAAPPDEAL